VTLDLTIAIPAWLDALPECAGPFDDDAQKMALCVALARENVTRGGGPFGAAVFDRGALVATGVNRVLDSGFSLAHAEVVALLRAQQRLPGLGSGALGRRLTLVTSAEPCCQCFGAIVWAGVGELVCGATTADVEEVGFDEGPKPAAWPDTLRARGFVVREEVGRAAARAVLQSYAARGGTIYGPR
jgi:tRNA(Arg) A34 adenosine deaminase TadA